MIKYVAVLEHEDDLNIQARVEAYNQQQVEDAVNKPQIRRRLANTVITSTICGILFTTAFFIATSMPEMNSALMGLKYPVLSW